LYSDDKEKRSIQIASIRLTKEIIEDVVTIIDECYVGLKTTDTDSSVMYRYHLEGRGKEFETPNRANFLARDIIRPDLTEVELTLASKNLQISVLFNLQGTSYINVAGLSPTEVDGVTSRLESACYNPKNRTKNYLFHQGRMFLVLFGLASVVVTPAVFSTLPTIDNPTLAYPVLSTKILLSVVFSGVFGWILLLFLRGLYPLTEIEGSALTPSCWVWRFRLPEHLFRQTTKQADLPC
jgi:hypothetical protein